MTVPYSVAGRVTLSVLDGTSKAVTFASPMRTSDYVVMLKPLSSIGVNLWTSNHSTTGFTINVAVALGGTIEYMAHEVTP